MLLSRSSRALRWTPSIPAAVMTAQRFHATVQAKSLESSDEFGPPVPAGQPKRGLNTVVNRVYVVEPSNRPGSFGRFLRLSKEHKWTILGSIVGVGIYSVATLAIPTAFGTVIDLASAAEFPRDQSVALIMLFGFSALGNYMRMRFIGLAGESMIASLRQRLYQGILRQPAGFFDSPANRTGALVQRLSADCNLVGVALTESMMQGSKNLCQTIGSIGVMLYYSPQLTCVIMSMVPPLAIYAGYYGRRVRKMQLTMQDRMAEMSTVAEERLGNIRTVKAFGAEASEHKWYQHKVNVVLDISIQMLRQNAVYAASLQAGGYLALYMIMWAGSLLVASHSITPGILFSFVLYTMYCGVGLMGLTNMATELNKGYAASLRLFDVIDAGERIKAQEAERKGITPEQPQWNVAFNAVGFAYPTRPEAKIYDQLTLSLQPGMVTCIVGSSGSGKSTLAHLLLRLYDADEGSITLDGTPITDISTSWLRSKVGYVGQEPVLFGGSIKQNIAYSYVQDRSWDDVVDKWLQSAVVNAALKANAHEFVLSLPQGYDTFVGEGGRSLSGGQKQRIAIARALLRNPTVLILDEATSALDSESEIVVHEAIERLVAESRVGVTNPVEAPPATEGGAAAATQQQPPAGTKKRIVLLFAHKLSMIRQADHIVVLDQGKVHIQGPFEVVSRDGLFQSLTGFVPGAPVAAAAPSQETIPEK